jgi:predicted molibdopterin-dependent oxidoreductase YjgC
VAACTSDITDLADLILPVASPYGREGTVTNDKGLVQWLLPALYPEGDVRPDWQVIAELGQVLTGDGHLYTCAGDVTWKINKTTPGYNQITRFRLGQTGKFAGSEAA